jgi:hypothetical protein
MSDAAQRFTVGKDVFPGRHNRGCDVCGKPLESSQRVYMLCHNATPWKAEDDEPEWGGYTWHVECDEGSLAALLA